MTDTIILYGVTAALVVVSLIKSREKTKKAFIKAWRTLENILPQLLGVFVLVGLGLALLDTETIGGIIGQSSGWMGVAIASVLGAVTLIPGFIAFPTAALLLTGGAGYMQIGAFGVVADDGRRGDGAGRGQVFRAQVYDMAQCAGVCVLVCGRAGDRKGDG